MPESSPNTFAVVVRDIARLFRPIAEGMESAGSPGELPQFFVLILEQAGIALDKAMGPGTVTAIRTHLTTIATAYDTIAPIVEAGEPPPLDQLPTVGQALASAFNAVKALSGLQLQAYGPDDALVDLQELGQLLLEFLLTDYLESTQVPIYNALLVLGIIERGKDDGATLAERLTRLRLPLIVELLRDPQSAFRERTGWGTDDFNPYRVLVPLAYFLDCCGFPAVLALPTGTDAEALGWDGDAEDGLDISVRIPLARHDSDVEAEAGFALLPLRSEAGAANGVALVPYGVGSTGQTIDLGGQWSVEYRVDGNVTVRYGLVVDFESTEMRALDEGAALPVDIDLMTLAAVRKDAEKGQRFTVFAQEGLGLLEVARLGLQLGFQFNDDGASFFIEMPVQDARLALSAEGADGFLQKVLPEDGFEQEFDVTVGWSSRTGVYMRNGADKSDFAAGRGFAGNGREGNGDAGAAGLASATTGGSGGDGLSTTVSVNADLLGIIKVDSVDLGVKPKDGKVVATAASTVGVTLGPLYALVEKMGVAIELSFPEEGANLGLFDLGVSFKPPAGAALKVDAAAVKGGGYLFFDVDNEQYAGMLELTVAKKISIKAIGLITTRLPDGSPGFSLFLLVTAEGFAPIQLGLGFTLNGVGGLLGVNRTVMTKVLREGLRQGTLDDVLFPKEILKRAPAIISNLGAVFPPSRGRYLFGPMAILGWGTPTLVSLKLAVILEIPDPVRLVVLGRLLVELPEPTRPVVRIQLDTVGEIDFDRGTVTLDGVLFESRILDFPLTGAMALRARWRDDPYFLFSIGGFNPRFPVPDAIPKLERLALSLSSTDSLRVRLEAYFALTSNTLQFGARLELFAKAGVLTLDAYFSFDALIQFSPFGFVTDMAASAILKLDGKLLAALQLSLVLSGPSPWHVHGKASVQILAVTWEVEVDYRAGAALPPDPPKPTDVGALLRAALHDLKSWTSELPPAASQFVTLREVTLPGVIAHPLAELVVRQRVVPFDYAITRFGNTRPVNERTFSVQTLVNGSAPATTPAAVMEHFAVSQYRDMSDDQKLTRPSFTSLAAGYRFGDQSYDFDGDSALESSIGYETLTLQPS